MDGGLVNTASCSEDRGLHTQAQTRLYLQKHRLEPSETRGGG